MLPGLERLGVRPAQTFHSIDVKPKLTPAQKAWMEEHWSSFTHDGKIQKQNKKWNEVKNGEPDWELLQNAKKEARQAHPDMESSPASSSDSSDSPPAAKSAIESDVPRVRARALLRATFGAKWWSFETDPKTGKSRATELHKERMKWALSVVTAPGFDPLNLPEPPYTIWAAWTPKKNIMLPFAGPITGIRVAGESPDGLDIVLYVKKRQMEFGLSSEAPGPIVDQVFDVELMKIQSDVMVSVFKDFMTDVKDMGKSIKDIIGQDNVSKVYTAGSGRFNRTLRIKPEMWKPFPDLKDTEGRLAKAREVWEALHVKDPYAPELVNFEAFKQQGLARVHAMWRLLYIAPRINSQPIYLLRSVTSRAYLPHSLAGVSDPAPGATFLDVGFVSTTVADANDYWGTGALSTFFDQSTKCCLMAIEAVPGTPMLPLFVEPSASVYPTEREVVLPPLTKWTYLGHEVRASLNNTHVYSYRVSMMSA